MLCGKEIYFLSKQGSRSWCHPLDEWLMQTRACLSVQPSSAVRTVTAIMQVPLPQLQQARLEACG